MNKIKEFKSFKECSDKYLDLCEIYGNADDRKYLAADIDISIKNKRWIIDLFRNHSGYNGKGQIVLPVKLSRPVDEDYIETFAREISRIPNKFLVESIPTDDEKFALNKVKRMIACVDHLNVSESDIVIMGKDVHEWKQIKKEFLDNNGEINWNYYTKDSINKYNETRDLMNNVSDMIRKNIGKTLTKSYEDVLPNCQAREGAKITKVIQKVLDKINYNRSPEFNKMFSKYCDAISPLDIPKWFVISVNFCDYLSMSNGGNWTSCLNTDKKCKLTNGMYSRGFNSKRTLDYALDPSTIVVYTVDSDYDGDEFELQHKNTRQLFHFNGSILVQSRMYPQETVSTERLYTQYREIVERVLADCMGDANLWSAPTRGIIDYDDNIIKTPYGYGESEYIDCLSCAVHGSDERSDFKDNVNYVYYKGSINMIPDNVNPVIVGSDEALNIINGGNFSDWEHESIGQVAYI